MSECLTNIKTIKILSWVSVFEESLGGIRNLELNAQFGKLVIGIMVISCTFLFPQLMLTITITVFVQVGNKLDISTAYSIKLIFNYIRDPIRIFPLFVSQLVDIQLAMRRVQEFLVCDEINPTLIAHSEDSVTALEVRHGCNFHWGI